MAKRTRDSVGWACVAHLSFCFEKTLYRTFHRCFLPNFGSFGYSVSEENIFLETRGSAHWACIAHLTIEWYWSKFQREIIITFKNSSHLEWRVGLSDTILKGTHPGTIYAKFGSIWPSCFRGEDFFNISQSEKRINLGDHVCSPNGTKWRNFIEDLT